MDTSGVHMWLVLKKAAKALEEHAIAHIARLDMCLTDFALLESLLHKGPMPVNMIGKKVFLTSGSITSAVDRLELKGFVTRMDSPEDRRVKIVNLTETGRAFINKAFSEHAIWMESAVEEIGEERRTLLITELKALGKSVKNKG